VLQQSSSEDYGIPMMRGSPAAEAAALAIPYKFAEAYARRDLQAVLAPFRATTATWCSLAPAEDERRVGIAEIREQIKRNLDQSRALFFRFDWVRASAAGPVAWVAAEGVMQAELAKAEIDIPVRFTGRARGGPRRMGAGAGAPFDARRGPGSRGIVSVVVAGARAGSTGRTP
jgi:hypothetical protein